MFTDHAHLEYDIELDTLNGSWLGSMFWGSLNFPYTEGFVSPALATGGWHHVEIDGEVGNPHPLTVTIDGQVRPNAAGTNNLNAGITGSLGTFCSNAAGTGAIDNIMFWAR